MTIRDGGYRLIVKHSEIHGHGCYAGEPIPAGAFIVEYKGNLVPAEEAYRLEQDATRTGIYTFWVGDEWAIDGWVEENTARYINHCCTPNCGYRVEGRRILIYADRDIAGGVGLEDFLEDRLTGHCLTPCATAPARRRP